MPQPPDKQSSQPKRSVSQQYTTQNADKEITPISVPWAACAAKLVPCSKARKNDTGPDVSGNPTSQPLTVGPNLRPTSVTPPSSNGVRISFSNNIFSLRFLNHLAEQRLLTNSSMVHIGEMVNRLIT